MMNKRVYGVLGISSIMSNWNADFTGYPKTTTDGKTFGSDKAFKYPMKKKWENEGKKVLYIKSMKIVKEKGSVVLIPRSLKERYEYLFMEGKSEKKMDADEVLKNLFTAIDVKNFGATFAEAGVNLSITGAVQIGQGYNFYDATEPQEQQILSPFRDDTKVSESGSEAKNSTLGTKIVSDEAHYFYPFAINPLAYKEFVELGVTKGYTEEDYHEFKHAAISSATSFATNAKIGCDNEFALFVETESTLYLPVLTQCISFEKGDNRNTIHIQCASLLSDVMDQIKGVEVYYNPLTTQIKCDLTSVNFYNIVTGKEV